MNTTNPFRLALVSLTTALFASVVSAAGASSSLSTTQRSNLPPVAVRAQDKIGGDVLSTDGRRVGAVADYVFEFGNLPQLRYVIVKSGGFLGLHADQRAIPADAITLVDNTIRVSLTSADFAHLPVMTSNHRSYLAYADNLTNMANLCGTPMEHAGVGAEFVLFSDLGVLSTVADKDGRDLGYFGGLWIDFNANEAPYLDIDPANGVLDSFGNIDYDVPTTEIASVRGGQIRLTVGAADFENLKEIDLPADYVAAAGEKLESAQNQPAQ